MCSDRRSRSRSPSCVATMASTAEIVLPILLAFGFLTRYAALGLLCMTAVIQLTYPDGWQNFHLPWATMALAIMAFGPGAVSVDRLSASTARRPDALRHDGFATESPRVALLTAMKRRGFNRRR